MFSLLNDDYTVCGNFCPISAQCQEDLNIYYRFCSGFTLNEW
jgi:hypothetical protein